MNEWSLEVDLATRVVLASGRWSSVSCLGHIAEYTKLSDALHPL